MTEVCDLNDFRFASGAVTPKLSIAYRTWGQRSDTGDNVVLVCHGASGGRDWVSPFCRPGGAFDPERWFIVSVDLPGGGDSSRRSTSDDFPTSYSIGDGTQAILGLMDSLKIDSLRAFAGPSMATLIGFDLAARHPGRVRALALWAGGCRADGYARASIDTMHAVLGLTHSPDAVRAMLVAILPALTSRQWIASVTAAQRNALVDRVASEWQRNWRVDELLARYDSLASADFAAVYGGEAGLAAKISCPLLLLQASSDELFPAVDASRIAALVPRGRAQILDTPLGHMANGAAPGSTEFAFFDRKTARFLQEESA